MRLWSIHPRYLDSKGLVALWREALLAQAVLRGTTKGYRHHPQLARFRADDAPLAAIANYLGGILCEAEARGYRFDRSKVGGRGSPTVIPVTTGQLEFEADHLRSKLRVRDPAALERIGGVRAPSPHPIFSVVDGPIADFERGAR